MSNQNKIFTTGNIPLYVNVMNMANPNSGVPVTYSTLEGMPLGTSDNSTTGEIGAKVIIIGNRAPTNNGQFHINPFDTQVINYIGSTNNISTIVFKTGGVAGTTVNTLTYSYVGAGAANDDLINGIVLT